MFDILQNGIEVRVVSAASGNPYHEWSPPPESPLYQPHRNVTYMEAVPGETFSVEVIIHPTFQWRGHDVQLRYNVDGDEIYKRKITTLRPPKSSAMVKKVHFSEFNAFNNGNWDRCSLRFAETQITDDSAQLTAEEEVEQMRRMGKIQVTVRIGTAKFCQLSSQERMRDAAKKESKLLQQLGKSTKRVVMENGCSNYTEHVPFRGIQRQDAAHGEKVKFTCAPGREDVEFTVYYTTREFLERKKIAPCATTPHPRADAAGAANNTENPTSTDGSEPSIPQTTPGTTPRSHLVAQSIPLQRTKCYPSVKIEERQDSALQSYPSAGVEASDLGQRTSEIKREESEDDDLEIISIRPAQEGSRLQLTPASRSDRGPPNVPVASQKRKREPSLVSVKSEDGDGSRGRRARQDYDRRLLELELEDRRDDEKRLGAALRRLDETDHRYEEKMDAWYDAKKPCREAERELLKFDKAASSRV